jgi:hypothetical protein
MDRWSSELIIHTNMSTKDDRLISYISYERIRNHQNVLLSLSL